MLSMSTTANVNGVSVDLSYLVAGLDCDGELAWIGPVVFVQDGTVYVDAWLGAGLSETELPDVDDATLDAIVATIQTTLESWDGLDGEDREPMTRDAVRAEVTALDATLEIETERLIAEIRMAA